MGFKKGRNMKKYILIFTLIIGLMVSLTGCSNLDKPVQERHINLYSLSNNTQISGSFFLGCGSISEKPVFYFYYGDPIYSPNSKALSYVYANDSIIYEDLKDGEAPYLVIAFTEPRRPFPGTVESSKCRIVQYEFHVPQNSINQTFNLDVSKIK